MSVYIAEIASSAAAEAAAEYVVCEIIQYTATSLSSDGEVDYPLPKLAIASRVATSAADGAVAKNTTVVGKLLKRRSKTETIIETAGDEAGRIAFKADTTAISRATAENRYGIIKKQFQATKEESIKAITREAKAAAVIKARRVGMDLNPNAETFIGKVALPFLNFLTAAWNAYEGYRAYREFTNGYQSSRKKRMNTSRSTTIWLAESMRH